MIFQDIGKYLRIADIFSIIGIVFAVFSMFFSLHLKFLMAGLCIYIGTVFDFLDGRVSRLMKRQGGFGVQLDGFLDTLLYLVSVTIFGYCIGLRNVMAVTVFVIFIVCGVLRLSRFAIEGIVDNSYKGLPTTYAIIIPGLYFLFTHFSIPLNYLLWFYFVPALLMVSSVQVKKV